MGFLVANRACARLGVHHVDLADGLSRQGRHGGYIKYQMIQQYALINICSFYSTHQWDLDSTILLIRTQHWSFLHGVSTRCPLKSALISRLKLLELLSAPKLAGLGQSVSACKVKPSVSGCTNAGVLSMMNTLKDEVDAALSDQALSLGSVFFIFFEVRYI